MKYNLVKVPELSGDMCSIYTIVLNGDKKTLLDKFIDENLISFESETKLLIQRLRSIGTKTGARKEFF